MRFEQTLLFTGFPALGLTASIAGDSRFALSKLTLGCRLSGSRRMPRGYRTPARRSRMRSHSAMPFSHSRIAKSSSPVKGTGISFVAFALRHRSAVSDTTDAWYAALAIESGCEWVTFDRGFARFPGLKCTILSASTPEPLKHSRKRIGPPALRRTARNTVAAAGDQLCGCGESGCGRLRRSAMNWSNSDLSLAKRSRSRKSRNSRCSSSSRRNVSVRYSSNA